VFEALCILAKKTGQQSFSGKSVYALAQQALQQCALKANPSAYVDDIVKITCLLLRDGEEHRFIHKTVQEYYTASYVQKKPEPWAVEFYGRVLKNHAHEAWEQELEFLSEIDSYRYNKYYLLPAILDFLGLKESDLDRPKEQVLFPDPEKALASTFIHFSGKVKEKRGVEIGLFHKGEYHFLTRRILQAVFKRSGPHDLSRALEKARPKLEQMKPSEITLPSIPAQWFAREGFTTVPLATLLKTGVAPEISSVVDQEYGRLFDTARGIRVATRSEENPSLLEGLV